MISCSKKRETLGVHIDPANLTACADNANCNYLFSEQADLSDGEKPIISGKYRLFSCIEETSGMSSALYIRAPMQGDQFVLNDNDIRNGKVVLLRSCSTCFMIPFKLAGGYVSGINTKVGSRADQSRWLLDAHIILKFDGESSLSDTLNVKQYFYPNFVID